MSGQWARAVVVGASSGIGEAVARQLGRQGTRVALLARRETLLRDIAAEINQAAGLDLATVYPVDVREWERAGPLLNQIVESLGGLDLLVYASGVMPHHRGSDHPTREDIEAIEVNLGGAVAWTNAAVELMLPHRSGTIVGISSIAGERGRAGNPVYNATKAGLNVYLESVRCRVATRGLAVVTVKPGFVRTQMVGSRLLFPPAVSSERAARDILRGVAERKRVIWVPWWWEWIGSLLRWAPPAVLERLRV